MRIFLAILFLHGLLGFFYFGEEDDDEGNHENGQSNHQGWRSVGNLSLGSVTDKSTHNNIYGNCCCAVEHATRLDELVPLVTAATEEVQHRVHNGVEDTHTAARNKSAAEIDCHAAPTGEPLDDYARNANEQADEGSLLVAPFLNHHASGEAHDQIGTEVAVVANHGHEVGRAELVFHDDAHG